MATLEIGYLLPTRDQAVLGEHEPGRLVSQARRAEELGLDSVWAGDSPVTRPRTDPLLLLAAAVAQATERVRLGTAVLLLALRHPILLAHQLAILDRLSRGRLIAGIGGGFPHPNTEAQFAAVGIGFASRVSRMEESIQALFAGTARQAADWLHGYAAAGARHLVIRLATDDHDSGLEEFAELVLPLLRKEERR